MSVAGAMSYSPGLFSFGFVLYVIVRQVATKVCRTAMIHTPARSTAAATVCMCGCYLLDRCGVVAVLKIHAVLDVIVPCEPTFLSASYLLCALYAHLVFRWRLGQLA